MKNELIGPPVDAPVLPEGYVYDVSLRTPCNRYGDPVRHKRYWKVIILKGTKRRFLGTTYRTAGRAGAWDFDREDLMDPSHLRKACERAFDDMETKELVKMIEDKYTGIHSGS